MQNGVNHTLHVHHHAQNPQRDVKIKQVELQARAGDKGNYDTELLEVKRYKLLIAHQI